MEQPTPEHYRSIRLPLWYLVLGGVVGLHCFLILFVALFIFFPTPIALRAGLSSQVLFTLGGAAFFIYRYTRSLRQRKSLKVYKEPDWLGPSWKALIIAIVLGFLLILASQRSWVFDWTTGQYVPGLSALTIPALLTAIVFQAVLMLPFGIVVLVLLRRDFKKLIPWGVVLLLLTNPLTTLVGGSLSGLTYSVEKTAACLVVLQVRDYSAADHAGIIKGEEIRRYGDMAVTSNWTAMNSVVDMWRGKIMPVQTNKGTKLVQVPEIGDLGLLLRFAYCKKLE